MTKFSKNNRTLSTTKDFKMWWKYSKNLSEHKSLLLVLKIQLSLTLLKTRQHFSPIIMPYIFSENMFNSIFTWILSTLLRKKKKLNPRNKIKILIQMLKYKIIIKTWAIEKLKWKSTSGNKFKQKQYLSETKKKKNLKQKRILLIISYLKSIQFESFSFNFFIGFKFFINKINFPILLKKIFYFICINICIFILFLKKKINNFSLLKKSK